MVKAIIFDCFGVLVTDALNEPLLRHIKQLRRVYKTAVLSNTSRRSLEAQFPGDELSQYFDTVVGSFDIGFAKPAARAYEVVADRLGVRLEECIMVDARLEYCESARAAGMKAVHYTSFEQMKSELSQLID